MESDQNLKDEIRNKLQPIRTALELLSQGKKVPEDFLSMAVLSLAEIEQLIDL